MKVSREPDLRPAGQPQKLLTPFFVFVLVAAIACWLAAWVFRDTYELLVTLVSVGCLLIVTAICAYFYVLTNTADGKD